MMRWKILVPVLALVLCFSVGSAFADELVSVKLGYQTLSPTGSLAGDVADNRTELDVEDDLNLDDSDNMTAEIALQFGDSRLSVNYLPIEFSGTGTLTLDGSFNGIDFVANDRVKSKLSIDLYDIGYTYYLVNMDDLPSRFQFGLELAVKLAEAEVYLNDLDQGVVETESVTAPIPTIGARTRVALADFIGLSGRIGYLEYDDNHFLDAEAQVEFSPLPTVGIYAGYRIFDLKIDEDELFVETEFSGPFAGAMVRF